MTPKKKKSKVKITWHFHELNGKIGKPFKYVYLDKGLCLRGFDTLMPWRFIQFYNKKVAKLWVKDKKFKIIKYVKWKLKYKKLINQQIPEKDK